MKKTIPIPYRRSSGPGRESGVALIIALISLFIMSTLAVGIMYSTQSEIWTTANYRAVTQARYIAEAGAQQALNYLMQYTPITGTTSAFPASFQINNMPITYTSTGQPLVMATSGMSGSKYADKYSAIDAATDTAFQTYFTNLANQTPFASLAPGCSGSSCPSFSVAVQLLTAFPKGSGSYLTRWKIVSEGTVNTIGSTSTTGRALVQVVEVVDNVMVVPPGSTSSSPTYIAGVIATGTGCGPGNNGVVIMSGGSGHTNSYCTGAGTGCSAVGSTSPTLLNTGGDVESYGNINLSGGASIFGKVLSPYYNAINGFACDSGDNGVSGGPGCSKKTPPPTCGTGGTVYAVNEDNSGSAVGCATVSGTTTCSQTTSNLPSPPPSYPPPIFPATVPKNIVACSNGTCGGTVSGCNITLPPTGNSANLGDVTFTGCAVVTFSAGTYNMDSLTLAHGARIAFPGPGNVVINILDQGSVSTPIDLSGGTVSNTGGDPAAFTVAYAGSKQISVTNGASTFGTIYAPLAQANLSGTGSIYGALIAQTVNIGGSGAVNYDSSLTGSNMNVNTCVSSCATLVTGPLHVDEFSWSAF